ncbi:PadR family transcriptional regulator [Nocardia sp. NPDC056000]|uniref:PadR family transcriptional regulator n=1 Tax=Nocardia sp. NPDC056000 TaxID=3345674 RepID=UPI0035E0EBCD
MTEGAHAILTPMAITTLSLLNEHPMQPYEMFQLLVRRHGKELTAVNPGSLYRTMAQLAKQGLVGTAATIRTANGADRTAYRITAAGRTALRDRIAELLHRPVPERPDLLIALSKSHTLPRREVITALRERITCLEADIRELDTLLQNGRACGIPRRYWVTTEYLRARAATEQHWLRGIVDGLESGDIDWERADSELVR